MDGSHTFSGSELPTYSSISPNDLVCNEWTQTTLVSDDPQNTNPGGDQHDVDTMLMHMIGPHNGANENWVSVGLIASYMSTRLIRDTDEPLAADDSTDPIANLFDAGDSHDDVIELMNSENDNPPYDHDNLVGALDDDDSLVVAQAATGGASGSGTVGMATGFCAPLGLIKIITDESPDDGSNAIGSIEVNLELVPGSYHGVYAERVI